MGNLVYPTLPGLMLPQGRAILPPKVHIRTTPSQREFRSRDALLPRYQYSLGYEFLRTGRRGAELASLVGFYSSVGGSFDSWLYLDPDDNTVADQVFGIGDGTTPTWQLLRSFGSFQEPVDAVMPGAVIKVAGVPWANLLVGVSGFEADSNGDGVANGWWPASNGSVSGTTYSRPAGNGSAASQQISATLGASVNDWAGVVAAPVSIPSGITQMTFAADVMSGGGMQCVVRLADGTAHTETTQALGAGSWTRLAVTHAVTPGATQITPYLWMQSGGGAARWVRFDNVQLQAGASATAYADQLASVDGAAQVTMAAAPVAGASLTWSGQFYRRCRFLGDRLDTEKFMADLFAAKKVEFISVKG